MERDMKPGNKTRLAAWLLTAAILAADVSGNGVLVYAMQPQETEAAVQPEQDTEQLSEDGKNTEDEFMDELEQEQTEHPETEIDDSSKQPEEESGSNMEQNNTENSENVKEERQFEEADSRIQQDERIADSENQEDALEQDMLRTQAPNTENPAEPTAQEAFAALLKDYDMYGVLTNSAEIPVYQEPFTASPVIQKLPSGYQVRFQNVVLGTDGVWFQVAFAVKGVEYTGFIQSNFVVSEDTRLTDWSNQYLNRTGERGTASNGVNVQATDLSAFPSSYRTFIKQMIQAHPSWCFVPMNTGIEWSDVVENEMVTARNLVDINHPEDWKSKAPGDYDPENGYVIRDGKTWVQASEPIVKYYLDPRNFLNETSVFQFEQLTYNSAYHNEAGVERILSGTFMSKKKLEDGSGGGITYAKAFMKIGKQLKVSPYFLASRIRQEQGVSGSSPLISGTYPGFEGYYNYFNISAYGLGEQVIINGLTEAKKEGWTTRYAALYGGAKKTAENYISKGQDTFYLQKFDVVGAYGALYMHQYMQNLLAADNEGKNVKNSYAAMGVLENSFVFKIPVYNNMPASLCPLPGNPLSKPTLKVSKNGYTSAKLSWSQVGGADAYQIYRKEGSKGSYVRIKTVKGETSTSYQDKNVSPGKTYYYKVRAYVKLNSGTKFSSFASEKTAKLTIPATDWTKFYIKTYTSVRLSWKQASVSGYWVYRKTDSGKFTRIKTLKGKTSLTYTDQTVLPGHTYSYKIRGYKTIAGKNYSSPYTSIKTAAIKIKAPQFSSASVSGINKAKLKWKKDSKATGYYIYRSTTEKGGYKKIKTINNNKTLNWTDSSISPGTSYYYKIRSYVKSEYGKGNSGYSKILMVNTSIDKPLVSSVSSSATGIKLKWKKSENATGYQIYRSSSYNGKYTSVKKVTKNSSVTFTDKNVTFGKTYYYKVRAYKTIGTSTKYSSWSAIVCGRPELEETRFTGISGISSTKATLKWSKVSGVQGYKLYRKTGKSGKYSAMKSISSAATTKYTDKSLKKNTTYYYKIRTWKKVDGKVRYSAYSKEWCVQTQ